MKDKWGKDSDSDEVIKKKKRNKKGQHDDSEEEEKGNPTTNTAEVDIDDIDEWLGKPKDKG